MINFSLFYNGNLLAYLFLILLAVIPSIGELSTVIIFFTAILLIFKRKLNPYNKIVSRVFLIWISYFFYFLIRGFVEPDKSNLIDSISTISPFIFFLPLLLKLPIQSEIISEKNISMAATFGSFMVALLSAVEYNFNVPLSYPWGTTNRVELLSGNALILGSIIVPISLMTILGWDKKTILGKLISIASLLTAALSAILFVQSRGALLAYLIASPFVVFYLNKMRKSSFVFLFLFFLTIISIFQFIKARPDFSIPINQAVSRIDNLLGALSGTSSDHSINQRIILAKGSLEAFKLVPIFGFGPQHRNTIVSLETNEPIKAPYSHLHNHILTHLIAGGLTGLLIMLLVVFWPFFLAKKLLYNKQDGLFYLSLIIPMSVTGIGITNIAFFHGLVSSTNLFIYLIFLALYISQNSKERSS